MQGQLTKHLHTHQYNNKMLLLWIGLIWHYAQCFTRDSQRRSKMSLRPKNFPKDLNKFIAIANQINRCIRKRFHKRTQPTKPPATAQRYQPRYQKPRESSEPTRNHHRSPCRLTDTSNSRGAQSKIQRESLFLLWWFRA